MVGVARPPEVRVRHRHRDGDRLVPWWYVVELVALTGARTNEGRQDMGHGKGPGEVLVWPAAIAHVLDFELVGTVIVLSRPAYLLRALRSPEVISTCTPWATAPTSTSSSSTPSAASSCGPRQASVGSCSGPWR